MLFRRDALPRHGHRNFGVIVHVRHQFNPVELFRPAERDRLVITHERSRHFDAVGFPSVRLDEHGGVRVSQSSSHTEKALLQEACHAQNARPQASSKQAGALKADRSGARTGEALIRGGSGVKLKGDKTAGFLKTYNWLL